MREEERQRLLLGECLSMKILRAATFAAAGADTSSHPPSAPGAKLTLWDCRLPTRLLRRIRKKNVHLRDSPIRLILMADPFISRPSMRERPLAAYVYATVTQADIGGVVP